MEGEEVLDFIASMVSSLAWPVAIAVTAFVLRRQLASMIDRATHVEGPGFAIDLAERAEEVTAEIASENRAPTGASARSTQQTAEPPPGESAAATDPSTPSHDELDLDWRSITMDVPTVGSSSPDSSTAEGSDLKDRRSLALARARSRHATWDAGITKLLMAGNSQNLAFLRATMAVDNLLDDLVEVVWPGRRLSARSAVDELASAGYITLSDRDGYRLLLEAQKQLRYVDGPMAPDDAFRLVRLASELALRLFEQIEVVQLEPSRTSRSI